MECARRGLFGVNWREPAQRRKFESGDRPILLWLKCGAPFVIASTSSPSSKFLKTRRTLGSFFALLLRFYLHNGLILARSFFFLPTHLHTMSSSHASLDAASNDRKARLAKLAALKRKQPEPDELRAVATDSAEKTPTDVTAKFLSGRNYDAETRGPKLGFEQGPQEGKVTVEAQAAQIAETVKEQAQKDEDGDQPVDLFKLQPKKPNWDLRRDLDEKLKILNVRTENAIARLVRQRIENAQRAAKERGATSNGEGGEEVGIEGDALVEGIHMREQEVDNDEDTI